MNVAEEGDRMPTGVPLAKIGIKEMEEAMKAHPHYSAPLDKPNQGRGVAVGFRMQSGQASSATINVNGDGTINLITGSVDIGGTRTAVAMQAAEVLGLRAEDVAPTVVDTDSIGYTAGTGGSRIAFDTGLAAISAAEDVKKQMGCPGRLDLGGAAGGRGVSRTASLSAAKNPADRLTFKELSGRLLGTGGPITCSASCPNGTPLGPVIAGNIVDVEVDQETGKVDVLRFTAFMDAGTAVHPSLRGRPDSRRHSPGHRLGLERRVFLQRRRDDAQLQLPRLPDAHQPGPAHDRSSHNRGPQPAASLWP